VSGRLQRITGYLMMGFGAVMGTSPPAAERALGAIALARAACRDAAPGAVGPALARIDQALGAAESLIGLGGERAFQAVGLVHSAMALAATEPVS